jgi:hypothetical protein
VEFSPLGISGRYFSDNEAAFLTFKSAAAELLNCLRRNAPIVEKNCLIELG